MNSVTIDGGTTHGHNIAAFGSVALKGEEKLVTKEKSNLLN